MVQEHVVTPVPSVIDLLVSPPCSAIRTALALSVTCCCFPHVQMTRVGYHYQGIAYPDARFSDSRPHPDPQQMKYFKTRDLSNLKALNIMALYLVIWLLLPSPSVNGQPRDVTGRVSGEVNISFQAEELSAKITHEYVAGEDREESITFYLNEAFKVKQVRCRLCSSFNFDPQAKPRPSLIIKLKESLAKGKRLPITIEYAGSLNKTLYKADQKYLELGLDSFWFPAHKSTSEFRFAYRLAVKTDEPNSQLISNGRNRKIRGGWLVTSKVPDFDINLILAEGLKVKIYNQQKYNLQLISKMPDEASASLLTAVRDALDFYNSTFGAFDPQREVTGVFRPFLEPQFGYFRKGYFVLPQVDDTKNIVFPVTHELAHYWWLNAGQQHAWLNESFAEYSAMLFVRKQHGVEAFRKILDDKRKESANLPPVYGFDRTKDRKNAPGVFYRKGAVMLSELETELGEQKFMEFLSVAAKAKVSDTDTLIEILSQVSSPEVAGRFLAKLKE